MNTDYQYVVGIGGVGKGILFKLLGSHDLGRNESRTADLTDAEDFCKLHIILNYTAVFASDNLPVYAVSSVGNDEIGHELLGLMQKSGINTAFMRTEKHKKTMYSVCYQFPNGDGGNITAANGANNEVVPRDIEAFFESPQSAGRGIVLSVPEVSIDARIAALKEGRKHNCFNMASILPGEVRCFDELGGFELVDLLAVNEEEAEEISNLLPGMEEETSLERCYRYLKSKNPDIFLIITLGKAGSISFYKDATQHNSALQMPVVNTAGAGDCFLGTIIAAVVKGVPLLRGSEDNSDVSTAQDLASIASSIKVSCKDSIDFRLNKQFMLNFIRERNLTVSDQIRQSFFDMM